MSDHRILSKNLTYQILKKMYPFYNTYTPYTIKLDVNSTYAVKPVKVAEVGEAITMVYCSVIFCSYLPLLN